MADSAIVGLAAPEGIARGRRTIRGEGRRWVNLLISVPTLIILGLTLLPTQSAEAATDVVTNCSNSGRGSLRQTVADASAGDIITFDMSPSCSTIDDPTGTILILTNLTIDGPGASKLALDGEDESGLFQVESGVTATISGLTIEDGSATSGGGVYNDGDLTISKSTVSSDTAKSGSGGGIYNSGTLTVSDDTLSDNMAPDNNGGGGIENVGTASISNSTIVGNYGFFSGGGIDNGAGTLTVTDSTLSGNSSVNEGGGVANSMGASVTLTGDTLVNNSTNESGGNGGGIFNNGTLTISNSTLSGNQSYIGGGIQSQGPTAAIYDSTVVGNSARIGDSGGIYRGGGTVSVRATLLADNAEGDCSGVTDSGYNIDDDGSCGFTLPSISDYATLSKTLGPLANNGGPTQTISLLPGSPAIDYVPAADCPSTDQRGAIRTPPCDIGAFDTDGNPTITSFSPVTGKVRTTVTLKGTNLSGATSVTFDGTKAKIKTDKATEIITSVPAGAKTGKISVTTSGGGTVTSTKKFRVT